MEDKHIEIKDKIIKLLLSLTERYRENEKKYQARIKGLESDIEQLREDRVAVIPYDTYIEMWRKANNMPGYVKEIMDENHQLRYQLEKNKA